MPVIHRQRLAARLRQNWSAMYPTETNPTTASFQMIDDSLTSLAWLQNLNIMSRLSSNSSLSPQRSAMLHTTPEDKAHKDPVGSRCMMTDSGFCEDTVTPSAALSRFPVDPNDILDMSSKCSPTSPSTPSSSAAAVAEETPAAVSRLDIEWYKNDASIKPPYSYAILICMAMQEKPDRRITLSQIYNWIADNFAYYRQADQNWQHSIRHNLSLNKCFRKIPRGKDEPGKGGFWTINPEFSSLIDRGIFKKRCPSAFGENFIAATVHTLKKKPTGIEKVTPSPSAIEARILCQNTEQLPPQKKDGRVLSQGDAVVSSTDDPFWSFATDSHTDTLSASWSNVIFNQDIEVGGISVKTEDILVDLETPTTVGLTTLTSPNLESPTTSSAEGTDSDLDMDALLCSAYSPSLNPVAPRSGDPLDLTIHGIGLQPPNWWNESLNGHFSVGGEDGLFSALSAPLLQPTSDSHMHTPLLIPFQEDDDDFHPWAENRDTLIGFDAGSVLLDTDNIDSFKLF